MQKIRFNNSNKIFDVTLTSYGAHRIKCKFYSELIDADNASFRCGFKELNENNLKVQGDFSKMKYIYHKPDDETFIFTSDKDDIYIESDKYEKINIATNTNESELYAPTLEEALHLKILELSATCRNMIVNGVDVIINGEYEHFSYKEEDQVTIQQLFDIATASNSPVYYHADHMACKLYTVDEITKLYSAAMIHKAHHLTYFNQLRAYLESLHDIEKINAVSYGQELTGAYLNVYQDAIKQTYETIDSMVSKVSKNRKTE